MSQIGKLTKISGNNFIISEIGPVQMYQGLFQTSKTASRILNKIMKTLGKSEMIKNYTPEVLMHFMTLLSEQSKQPAIIFNDLVRAANKSPEQQETLRQIMAVASDYSESQALVDISQQEEAEIRTRLLNQLRKVDAEEKAKKEANETKVISGN